MRDQSPTDTNMPATAPRATAQGEESATGDELWMIQAIIQPFRLDRVTRALEAIAGFGGMTVTAVQGFGQEELDDRRAAVHGPRSPHPPRESVDDFSKKLRLDIAVRGRQRADDLANVIARTAHTGNRGDGKIFLWPIARAIRVRTMEVDRDAL